MKIAFVGPSLPQAIDNVGASIAIRPPAVLGDLVRALGEGASAICLIDGLFENQAPVRHKEILFALSQGVTVIGAASMGALRAAECAAFGMQGIGRIYESYAEGKIIDDADVALLHAPSELGYAPITLPLVNVRATLEALVSSGQSTRFEAIDHEQRIGAIFYKERTWRRVKHEIGAGPADRLRSYYVDQKKLDALAALAALDQASGTNSPAWAFNFTEQFRASIN